MNRILEIYKYEFKKLVLRKGFIIMTLLIPVLFAGVIFLLDFIFAQQKDLSGGPVTIGVVLETEDLIRPADFAYRNINFAMLESSEVGKEKLADGSIDHYLVFTDEYFRMGYARLFTNAKSFIFLNEIQSGLNHLAAILVLGDAQSEMANRLSSPLALITTVLDAQGDVAGDQGGISGFIIPVAFGLLMAMSIIFTSTYMIQGLGGEKENRVIEIILSSVTSDQLLVGKLSAFASAGLIQALVWVGSLPLLKSLLESRIGNLPFSISITHELLVYGSIYFILGYILFSTIAAGAGASRAGIQEAQQFSTIYSLATMVPYWLLSIIINFPDMPFWKVLSVFPLTAPSMAMISIGMGNYSILQGISGIVAMLLAAAVAMMISRRVFRKSLLDFKHR